MLTTEGILRLIFNGTFRFNGTGESDMVLKISHNDGILIIIIFLLCSTERTFFLERNN